MPTAPGDSTRHRPVPRIGTRGDAVYLEQTNQADNADTLAGLRHRSHRDVRLVHLWRTHAPQSATPRSRLCPRAIEELLDSSVPGGRGRRDPICLDQGVDVALDVLPSDGARTGPGTRYAWHLSIALRVQAAQPMNPPPMWIGGCWCRGLEGTAAAARVGMGTPRVDRLMIRPAAGIHERSLGVLGTTPVVDARNRVAVVRGKRQRVPACHAIADDPDPAGAACPARSTMYVRRQCPRRSSLARAPMSRMIVYRQPAKHGDFSEPSRTDPGMPAADGHTRKGQPALNR